MSRNDAGSVVLDLGPETGYARHSEGSFATCEDGSLLLVWSRFEPGGGDDFHAASLVAARSADGGLTWSAPELVLDHQAEGARNVMSVSLLRLQDGRLAMTYLRRHGFDDMRPQLRISEDDGHSWGEAQCCVPALGYYVANNDRLIQLRSGRLVLPAAFHRSRYTDNGLRSDAWATSYAFFSDDGGRSWRESTPSVLPFGTSRPGLQEPGVVELSDGTLWGWARTDQGAQWEFRSSDGGETWSVPQPSAFSSPRSPMSVKRLANQRLVAVWNPVAISPGTQLPAGGWTDGRTPLVMAYGDGLGREWSDQVVLEDDPDSGYCYTAVHEVPGALLLAYCAGSATRDRHCLARLRVRRIPTGDEADQPVR